jgi:hypothetical protein
MSTDVGDTCSIGNVERSRRSSDAPTRENGVKANKRSAINEDYLTSRATYKQFWKIRYLSYPIHGYVPAQGFRTTWKPIPGIHWNTKKRSYSIWRQTDLVPLLKKRRK